MKTIRRSPPTRYLSRWCRSDKLDNSTYSSKIDEKCRGSCCGGSSVISLKPASMRRSKKSRPTWRPFEFGRLYLPEVVMDRVVPDGDCRNKVFLSSFAPDSGLSGPAKGCGQGRAFSSAFIGAKRRPLTAVLAGLIEDHPGRRTCATSIIPAQ